MWKICELTLNAYFSRVNERRSQINASLSINTYNTGICISFYIIFSFSIFSLFQTFAEFVCVVLDINWLEKKHPQV